MSESKRCVLAAAGYGGGRKASLAFETALNSIWFELDLNVIGGEHKVGQAVSYSSDGFIALNRLPESLPAANSLCEQEDICV